MAQTDLQIHSSLTAGGELSPRALAERCCEERLTLAALTDRRAVSGMYLARRTARCAHCARH